MFKNLFKRKKEILIPLDEDKIRRDEIIKAQQQKIVALEAQIKQFLAEQHRKSEEEKLKDKDIEIKRRLNEREEELKNKDVEQSYSLGNLFYKLYDFYYIFN